MTKARGYLTKAKQREQRAKKTRDPEHREWQLTLARAYRILAETENEMAVARRLPIAA